MELPEGFLDNRYWNGNGKGICIVAKEGAVKDWAAYIFADDGWSEEDLIVETIKLGTKLLEKEARAFFPNIKLRYRH